VGRAEGESQAQRAAQGVRESRRGSEAREWRAEGARGMQRAGPPRQRSPAHAAHQKLRRCAGRLLWAPAEPHLYVQQLLDGIALLCLRALQALAVEGEQVTGGHAMPL
jgi:hypothetical protein